MGHTAGAGGGQAASGGAGGRGSRSTKCLARAPLTVSPLGARVCAVSLNHPPSKAVLMGPQAREGSPELAPRAMPPAMPYGTSLSFPRSRGPSVDYPPRQAACAGGSAQPACWELKGKWGGDLQPCHKCVTSGRATSWWVPALHPMFAPLVQSTPNLWGACIPRTQEQGMYAST